MFELLQSEPGLRRTTGRSLVLFLSFGLVSTATLCWVGGHPLGVRLLMYRGSLAATVPMACWLLWSASSAANHSSRWTANRFQLAWASLLVVDLWAMGWPLVDARPQASIYTPPSCIQFLIERGTDHERILDREVPEHGERSALGLALPIIYRLEPLRGYNPIDIHRYKEYIQFISDRDEPVAPFNGIPNFPMVNKSLLDVLAVRDLVQPSDLPAMAGEPTDVAQDPRWQAIAVDPRPRLTCSSPGGDNNCRRSRCTRIGTRFPKPSWFPGPNRFLSGVACCPRSSKPTCAGSRFLRTLSRRAVSQTPRGDSAANDLHLRTQSCRG